MLNYAFLESLESRLTKISELNGVWLSQRYVKCKTLGA